MRRSLRCLVIAAIFMVVLPLRAAVVPDNSVDKLDTNEVRKQLSSYFANIGQNSPTVLGGLAKSPEAMGAVQQRIASMSEQELAQFQKLMTEMPDWRVAPEAIAHAFPPEVLEQIRRVGADYVARAPQGEKMRDDVATLLTVLKQLPDAKLKELGIDRPLLASLEQTFAEMSTLQAAMLQRRAAETSPWDVRSAAALAALPPELQRGAAALAEHGPLTEKEIAELEKFRKELIALFERIDKLPPETRKTLKAESLREQVRQLGLATPDVLFMLRHHVPDQMLKTLAESVALLERIANLSQEDREKLERFRQQLKDTFAKMQPEGADPADLEAQISALRPDELFLMQGGFEKNRHWQVTLPAFYQTLSSPGLAERVAAVQGPQPDPAAVQFLESFRQQALTYIDTARALPGIDVKLAEQARRAVEAASLPRLELMRSMTEKMPPGAPPEAMLSIGAMHDIGGCSIGFCVPVPLVDDPCFNFSLDFICNAIEDVEHSIVGTVNEIVDAAKKALQESIDKVKSTVDTLVTGISDTVNLISTTVDNTLSFVKTVPNLVINGLQAALKLLLDIEISGVKLRNLADEGVELALNEMPTLLRMAGDWWTAISTFTLPSIPCPPKGFHTPWGNVGDGDAFVRFDLYALVIEELVGMIPETEVSLAVKIPAQVNYAAFKALGKCLEQAADAAGDAAADAEATEHHTSILENFTGLSDFIALQIAGLSVQAGDQTDQLFTAVDTFKKLNVRLIIERVLQTGVGGEVALLQLPAPFGHIELVRDIVQETLDGMVATQQGIGQAQKFFDKGVEFMNAGRYKDAFKQFGMAYRELTATK